MVNYHSELVNALKQLLPTYYELTLNNDCSIPCLSYIERDNYEVYQGNTLGYSKVSYQVKVWANDIKTIQEYSAAVDDVLRPLGFKRINSGELYDRNSTMIQKIMIYEALFNEAY